MPAANPWKKDAKGSTAEQASPSPEPPKGATGRSRGKSFKGKEEAKAKEPESSDSSDQEDNHDNNPGRIRNLARSFTTAPTETKTVRKKRLEVTDTADPIVLENEPVERLEGVVRSNDPGEWEKPIELEKGRTKNMASMFLNRQDDDTKTTSKKPFVMDLDQNAAVILESEPVQLEGVVRSQDKVKDVICKRGRIKHIAGRFTASGQPLSDEEDDGEASGGAGTSVWTDTPSTQVQVESGKTRGLAERFTSGNTTEPRSSRNGGGKPQWMIELENAQDGGVFENEPEGPIEGVVRADDEQPDVISVQHTRNLKAMWSQFEKDEMSRDGSYQPQRRSDIVVRTKKEPTPEPEPEPEPQPTKSRFGANKKFGQSTQNVAVVFDKNKSTDEKSSGGKKGAAKGKKEPEPEPPEPAKDAKGFTKPALKSVNRKF